mgnify:FL=1
MDKLITRKEAASILRISVKTLDAARTDGLISYVQYVENGCVYFTEVGIQEYIANGMKNSVRIVWRVLTNSAKI